MVDDLGTGENVTGSFMGAHGTPMFHGLGATMYTSAVRPQDIPARSDFDLLFLAYDRIRCRRFQASSAAEGANARRCLGRHRSYWLELLVERTLVH